MKTKTITQKKATDRKRMSGALNLNADEMSLLGCDGDNRKVGVIHNEDSITIYKIKPQGN